MIAAVDLAALQRAFFFPAELGKTAVERLAIIAAVAFGIDRRAARLQPRQPVRHFRGANQVAAPHLGAVDPEVARRQFDQPLTEERPLVAAGRAIGARGGLVGQQRRHGHPHVRHAIWTGEGLRQGARLNEAIGAHIGAEIDEDLAAHPEDRAVGSAGDLNLAIGLAGVIHRDQVLAPVLEPADGASDMPGRERDQEVLGIELAAGAEAAADIVLDQVDMLRRQPEHRRQCVAIEERHLCRAEYRHPPLGRIPLREYPARFHRQRGVALGSEALAPDVVGLAERRIGVAFDPGKDHRDIRAGLFEQQNLASPGGAPIRDRRQLLDVEVDRADTVLGQRGAVRQHDRDRLADIADAVGGDHRLQEALRSGQRQQTQRNSRHRADLFRGDDGPHAG